MKIQSLTRVLFQLICRHAGARRRAGRAQPILPETLECRQLMTATVIGTVAPDGLWAYDTNGGSAADIDRRYGLSGDQFVSGRWGTDSAFGDLPGVARVRGDGFLQWYLNTDGDITPGHEVDFLFGLAGDTAVAGDWNGDGRTDAGVVRNNAAGGLTWYLDLDRDPEPEIVQSFGLRGDVPVVGDWDNNGTANVGVVRTTANGFLEWHLDVTGDAWPEVSRVFGLRGDKPVVGDWDDNGRIDLGVARVSQSNSGTYEWYRDVNADSLADLPVIRFGSTAAKPVAGRWMMSEVSVAVNAGGPSSDVVDGQSGSNAISFGRTPVGSDARRAFTVRNDGTRNLVLSNLTLPAGFSLMDPLVGNLAPGQQDVFVVRMDTSLATRPGGDISFLTNDGNESPFNFTVVGEVQLPYADMVVSGDGAFGNQQLNATGRVRERTFTVTNPGNIPLTFQASSDSDQFVIVSGTSGTVAPNGGRATIVVRMQTASSGLKEGTLTISSNSSNPTNSINTRPLSGTVTSGQGAQFEVVVTGNGAFGDLELNATGSVRERTFTVTNPGNTPVTFQATSNSAHFQVVSGTSGTIPPNGGRATIIVRIQTTSIGPKQGALTIRSTAGNAATSITAKSLFGLVSTAEAGVNLTGSTNFGVITTGSVSGAEREFIVTNNGTVPFSFNATLSNSGFVFVSGKSATVAANGGTTRIVIRMPANLTGDKSATLRLSTIISRTLTGKVVTAQTTPPEVAVTVGQKTLSPGEIGQIFYSAGSSSVRTQTFVIRNSGNGPLLITNPSIVGEYTHNMPVEFTIAAGGSRTITVSMHSTLVGTKLGRLMFTTNDSDEAVVRINLLGRKLDAVIPVQGSATNLLDGTYTIYHSGADTIYIDPSHGRTSANGTYAITVGGSKQVINPTLRKVVVVSTVRPNVENWTGVDVVWKNSTSTVVIPGVRNRTDLFDI